MAQLAAQPMVIENALMMRAEPWRKQSLHQGDVIPEAGKLKEYEPVANFNWVPERRRVVDILGLESFSEFATLQ